MRKLQTEVLGLIYHAVTEGYLVSSLDLSPLYIWPMVHTVIITRWLTLSHLG